MGTRHRHRWPARHPPGRTRRLHDILDSTRSLFAWYAALTSEFFCDSVWIGDITGDGTTVGLIELFDPGHAPIIAWRPAEHHELKNL